ncbi:hypothetical protein [Uliginosibacterium aquaticum]|uniref:Uncharacterized protein n=1 Tax=Uliginosibacterium aquaticum TaxID=2731212 RepID=A0ABX2IE17_9RHOO|nr:hypothetical protein [Uliginosibacterium aquaticum]NSL54871.1 hypothetical protein [Uliginosibacterium aquaticum]
MPSIVTVQAIENATGVHLYAFDQDDNCVLAIDGLQAQAAASLAALMQACIAGRGETLGRAASDPVQDYQQVTDEAHAWEIIAELEGGQYTAFEADMGRAGLRLAGAGYVLGLLHRQPEGNWFEHAGEGSIWQYVFASPVAAEQVLDEVGLDCEIHAIPRLLEAGCQLI